MKIERTIAAAVLALGLSALLYAQAPGLFSTLEVDGNATFYASGIIDDHNLHTATGSSTGTGERSIAYQALSFVPALSGDALCSVFGDSIGWTIRTSVSARWGEFDLPGLGNFFGVTAVGSDLWVVADSETWRVSQSNPSTGTEFSLPSGFGNARGVTAVGSDLWVVDTENPRSVWRVPQSDPTTGTEFVLPVNNPTGITASGANLWVVDTGNPNSVWRVPQSDPTTGTEFVLPSGVGDPTGIAASGANLWVANDSQGNNFPPVVWRVPQSDPTTGTEFVLPSGVTTAQGITADGSDLWIVVSANNVWRVPQSNPAAMDCGGTSDTNTLEWTYMTGSDDPAVWVRRTAAGEVVELWQAEDAPAAPPIGIPPWQTTTDTVVMPGPPPTATLTALYAGADTADLIAALQALGAYVSGRGWLSGVSAVGDIANVPESGCGAPGGDCEPAARLHALRALAEAVHPDAPDAVFELVSESLRVDAAGGWSVTP